MSYWKLSICRTETAARYIPHDSVKYSVSNCLVPEGVAAFRSTHGKIGIPVGDRGIIEIGVRMLGPGIHLIHFNVELRAILLTR